MAPRGGAEPHGPGAGLGEAGRTGLSGEGERMEGARTFLGPGWLVAQVQIVSVAVRKGLKGSPELGRWGLLLAFLQGR